MALQPDFAEAHNGIGAVWSSGIGPARPSLTPPRDPVPARLCRSPQQPGRCASKPANLTVSARLLPPAVELKPEEAEMHINLGMTLDMLGELEEAIVRYRRCWRLIPKTPTSPACC